MVREYSGSAAKRQCSPYETAVKKHTDSNRRKLLGGGGGGVSIEARNSSRSSTRHSFIHSFIHSHHFLPVVSRIGIHRYLTKKIHSLRVVLRYEVGGRSGAC